jgi:ubiquinone/menaquinone biosynthesis C-methylase UbiE
MCRRNKSMDEEKHPPTYVAGRASADEIVRLDNQDRLYSEAFGGAVPEQQTKRFANALDVGSGSGGWGIKLAKEQSMIKVIGIDVSRRYVEYANAVAKTEKVSDRVQFQTVDALQFPLPFESNTFDLINLKFAISWVRVENWGPLLLELIRVAKPNATIRVTDLARGHISSPAALSLTMLLEEAMYKSGLYPHNDPERLLNFIPDTLIQFGVREIYTKYYRINLHENAEMWELAVDDAVRVFRTSKAFVRRVLGNIDDYDDLYAKMVTELQDPEASMIPRGQIAWGTVVK